MVYEKWSIGFHVVDSTRPWKMIPLGLALFQLGRRLKIPVPRWSALHALGVPVNLFDTVRLVAKKR